MHKRIRRSLLTVRGWPWVAVGLLSIVAAGCGGDTRPPAGGADAVDVTGMVTFDGTPLKGGMVNFKSADGGGGGPIDASGRYKARVAPGEYQVGIVHMPAYGAPPTGGAKPGSEGVPAPSPSAPPKASSPGGPPKPGAAPGSAPKVSPGTAAGSLLPPKYSDPSTSGLTATVVKEGKNEIDFNLTP